MKENRNSLACLIFGILSCVFSCMCLGFPLGILGIVLFVLSTKDGKQADAKAVCGLIFSIVGFIISLAVIVLFLLGVPLLLSIPLRTFSRM